jgi:hypothetical protein
VPYALQALHNPEAHLQLCVLALCEPDLFHDLQPFMLQLLCMLRLLLHLPVQPGNALLQLSHNVLRHNCNINNT